MVTSTSSTSSATASIVTALGAGSGVDMAALASNLASAQFAGRVDRLSAKSDKLTTQISAASNIKAMLLNLDTSLGTLVRSGDLARTPKVANSGVASATLSGAGTPSGTFSLEVSQLASAQRLASKAYTAATDTVGSGTLTLRFGAVSGGSFTEDTNQSAVDITIASGASLTDVASAINGANAGVTAYVANTVDGAQLVLRGKEGANSGFILEASEDSGDPGLSDLAWNPSSGNGTLLNTAQDAAFKVDGLSMTSTSNAAANAIPGVNLQLTGTNVGAPTTITFSDPTATITAAMQDFTDALNAVMTELNTATGIGGDLAADSGARALKRSLSQMAGSVVMPNATGAARTLADLGLSTQRDGTYVLDSTRLQATMKADPEGVLAMFTNGINGVYSSYDKIYRAASSSTNPGSLGGSISRFTKQLSQVSEDQTTIADQQEALRARLSAQFTVSETRIAQSKSTLTFIENQIAMWTKSSN